MLEGTSTDRNVPNFFFIIYLKYDFLLDSSHFFNFIFFCAIYHSDPKVLCI